MKLRTLAMKLRTLAMKLRTLARFAVPLALLGIGFGYGFASHWKEYPPYDWVMKWHRRLRSGVRGELGWWVAEDAPGATMRELEALGYLESYKSATAEKGIGVYDPARCSPGLNLYNSAHAASAVLMTMEGEKLHEWSKPYKELWPELWDPKEKKAQQWFRRVRLLPNGDLIAIYDPHGMVLLDAGSNVRWKLLGKYHHDFDLFSDGRIAALCRDAKVIERIHPRHPVLEDTIMIVSPQGEVLRRISLLEAFERSSYASFLADMADRGDIFHTNSIQLLDGKYAERLAAFAAGNALVSVRELDTIAVVDLEHEIVVWALSGQWHRQHESILLENGNILLFDNLGRGGLSKVIEIDPLTQEIVWSWNGDGRREFVSQLIGCNQRLPNGNTLITDSLSGRAVEVTPDGAVVWEFQSPHRSGEKGDRMSVLMAVERLPSDLPLDWLERD